MKKEMVIDGTTYVPKEKKSDHSKLVFDCSNVMGVFDAKFVFEGDEEIYEKIDPPVFPDDVEYYKLTGKLSDCSGAFEGQTVETPNGTRVSLEYVTKARRIISILHNAGINSKPDLLLFEGCNKKDKILKDIPIIFKSSSLNAAVMIAPRLQE